MKSHPLVVYGECERAFRDAFRAGQFQLAVKPRLVANFCDNRNPLANRGAGNLLTRIWRFSQRCFHLILIVRMLRVVPLSSHRQAKTSAR